MTIINEQMPLEVFTEKAYLDYSMYVILDRALPHIADGFKPVQRRIIYAMSELGLKATAKPKKSARTVGDVLGKFHPHGDTACYEAMVLMAQTFSYRYPFIDGQGNWGSLDDPKSFAAMRYTEARLSPFAELLLSELQQGTVTWVDNFDATLQEPSLLPARLPNVLLNGATGIAVGMSADLLPHNLIEVANACIHVLDNPQAMLEDVLAFIQGPDFPSAAEIITPRAQLKKMYTEGIGSVKLRAVYQLEKHEQANHIVITALPYQVSGAKVIEQIAMQMQQKKLPMIEDIRDESDHEHPTRLVIIPRSNRVDVDSLLSHLYATTELERSYRVNFNVIGLDGKPQVKNLLGLIHEWLSFRFHTVRQRLEHRLNKVMDRLHVLDGLLIAYLNLDIVIAIIREADEPKEALMSQLNLGERQAEAILEIKLRHLAKLEEIKLRTEQTDLQQEHDQLKQTLSEDRLMRKLIKQEISSDRDRYGDVRRSPIVTRQEAQVLKEEDVIVNEPITVVLSNNGWVRAAKGDIDGKTLSFKVGDAFKAQTQGRSNQAIVFFDSEGKVYTLPGHTLPSARGQGEPLSSKLNLAEGSAFVHVIGGDPEEWIILASSAGYGFIAQLSDLYVKNRNGKSCINLPQCALVTSPHHVLSDENTLIACVTYLGCLLIFPAHELPKLKRGKGNKLIQLIRTSPQGEDRLLEALPIQVTDQLHIETDKRKLILKPKDWEKYQGTRGQKGKQLPRGIRGNLYFAKITATT